MLIHMVQGQFKGETLRFIQKSNVIVLDYPEILATKGFPRPLPTHTIQSKRVLNFTILASHKCSNNMSSEQTLIESRLCYQKEMFRVICAHSKEDFTTRFTSVLYTVHIVCIKCNYSFRTYLYNSPHVNRCLVVSVCLHLISCKALM